MRSLLFFRHLLLCLSDIPVRENLHMRTTLGKIFPHTIKSSLFRGKPTPFFLAAKSAAAIIHRKEGFGAETFAGRPPKKCGKRGRHRDSLRQVGRPRQKSRPIRNTSGRKRHARGAEGLNAQKQGSDKGFDQRRDQKEGKADEKEGFESVQNDGF